MEKFDIGEIGALLHIHSETLKHPVLKNIRDATMDRLREIDGEMEKGEAPAAGPRVLAAEDPKLINPNAPQQNLPEGEDPLTTNLRANGDIIREIPNDEKPAVVTRRTADESTKGSA